MVIIPSCGQPRVPIKFFFQLPKMLDCFQSLQPTPQPTFLEDQREKSKLGVQIAIISSI